ncbi:uracil phosphoribosyltransferase [Candidatus Dependentiae bacterium]|nr:uracil phosphoribosyltransferase [Candidatus Dependentiae bacterium]
MKKNTALLFCASFFATSSSVAYTDNQNLQTQVEMVQAPQLVTRLRKKESTIRQFRDASDDLAYVLASATIKYIPVKEIEIETLLAPTIGHEYKNNTILVPILRSGETLLHPFLQFFKKATVGTIGLERDEKTAEASTYYEKFPKINPDDTIIILDPMLATGGSSGQTIDYVIKKGAEEENIIFVGVIAATAGINHILSKFPKIKKIIVAAVDIKLNDKSFIVPGLGDYGDRYFGTNDYENKS